MEGLQPYLTISENCEAALDFYKDCFDGEVVMLMRWKEAPGDCKDENVNPDGIMHAEFKSMYVSFMASEGMGEPTDCTNPNIALSVQLDDPKKQQEIFKKLSTNGTVLAPLEKSFWGAIFGMVKDQYGFQWMLNVPLSPDEM